MPGHGFVEFRSRRVLCLRPGPLLPEGTAQGRDFCVPNVRKRDESESSVYHWFYICVNLPDLHASVACHIHAIPLCIISLPCMPHTQACGEGPQHVLPPSHVTLSTHIKVL